MICSNTYIFFDDWKDHALKLKEAVIDTSSPFAFSKVLGSL